jgi:chorismate dehydratase
MTGLPFVFAAWVSNKKLSQSFVDEFAEANSFGFLHLDEVIGNNPFTAFDLEAYYTSFIKFRLNAEMLQAAKLFIGKMGQY